MQVDIACRHGSIGNALQEHTKAKSEKLLTFFERVTAINVTYDFNKERVRVEILVDAEHKHNFVAHSDGEDAHATFDAAYHKMEQQIKKYKEKVQDHRREKPLGEMSADMEQATEE